MSDSSSLEYRVATHSREKKITPATPKANTKTPMKFKRQTTPSRQRNPRKTVDLKDAKEKQFEFQLKSKRGAKRKSDEEEEEEEEEEREVERYDEEKKGSEGEEEEEEEQQQSKRKKKGKKAKTAKKKQKTTTKTTTTLTTTETIDDEDDEEESSSTGTAITSVPISKAHVAIQEIVSAQCKLSKTEHDGGKKFLIDSIDEACKAFIEGLPALNIVPPASSNGSSASGSETSRVRRNQTNVALRRQEVSLKETTRRFEAELARWSSIERAYSSIADVSTLKRDVNLSAEDQRLLQKLKELESSGLPSGGPTQAFTHLLSQAAQVNDMLLQLTRFQETADANYAKVKSVITSTAFEPYLPDMQNPMKLIESLAGNAPF